MTAPAATCAAVLDLSHVNSIGEALRDATIPFKSNVALIEANRDRETRRLTYAELCGEAEGLGKLLQQGPFAPGERCAILMSNQARWLTSATGALWAGATLVPVDYKLPPEEQAALLEHAGVAAVFVEYPVWRRLEPVLARRMRVLVSEAPPGTDLGNAVPAEPVSEGELNVVARRRDDVACIVYSSGTGGTPKGCVLTHGNYLEQAQTLGRMFPMLETDRFFSILPTNHAIDFMCGFLIPMLFGASVVHQRTLRPQFLATTMQRYGVTHMALVPMLLTAFEQRVREQIDALPSWKRVVLEGLTAVNRALTQRRPRPAISRRLLKPIHDGFGGQLKLLVCGGAFVDRQSAEFMYRLGLPVAIGYGLTEACTVVSVNDLEPFRGDTVGCPVPGVEVEIREPGTDGVGEVWVRGGTLMRGYLDAPELTAETLVAGWLRTGDLGKIDAAGHLKLVGRQANMVVTAGGKNVYPEDVEAAFDDLPDCQELCVMAADYIWPRRSMRDEALVVVLRPDGMEGPLPELLDALRAHNSRLAAHKRVFGYVVWSAAFPRTASLKIKRSVLARQVGAAMTRVDAVVELQEAARERD